MHLQQSSHTLNNLRLGACHFLLNLALFSIAIGLITFGFMTDEKTWIWYGTTTILLWVISCIVFFLLSLTWYCPLCMGKIWVKTGARRHRKAQATMGLSYRTHVALCVVFKKQYRCTYCGESFSTRKARR